MRLKEKDFNLLKQGGSYIVGNSDSYTRPEYGIDERDYVEFHVYDTDDTLLKSGITRNFKDGDAIRVKPGDNLREVGFITGTYKVVYNFFRHLAGADEVVLTHTVGATTNEIYTGAPWITGFAEQPYWVNDKGMVYIGLEGDLNTNPTELDIKDYKYFVQEISPSRTEVRLAPLDIKQNKYKTDFETLYQTLKIYKPNTTNGDGTGTFTVSAEQPGLAFDLNDSDPGIQDSMIGGTIELKNAFIVGYQTASAETSDNANAIANMSGEELEVNWDYTVPGWDDNLHGDAVKPRNWSVGYNSGVEAPSIGHHAKWVMNEGRNNSNCMKFVDKNNQFVDQNGQSLSHRWLGINQHVNNLSSRGLDVGDQIKVTWWQKSDVLGKGTRVGLHHTTGNFNDEPMPTEPPNGLDLAEPLPDTGVSIDDFPYGTLSPGKRWIQNGTSYIYWFTRILPELNVISAKGAWIWTGSQWVSNQIAPTKSFENNISTIGDFDVQTIGEWEQRTFITEIGSNWDLDSDFRLYVYGNKGETGILWVDDIQLSFIYSKIIENTAIYQPYTANIVSVQSSNQIIVDQSWVEQALEVGHLGEILSDSSPNYPFTDWGVTYKVNDSRQLTTLLNFSNNKLSLAINYKKDDITVSKWPHSVVYKLYDELSDDIEIGDTCFVVREMAPTHTETVNLINFVDEEISDILLRSPNLQSVDSPIGRGETQYKTKGSILTSDTAVSKQLEDEFLSGSFDSVNLNIDYSQFANFVNFSSVEQRLKNFKYKLEQIETNVSQSASLATNNNPTTSSLTTQIQKYERNTRKYVNEFDGFEKYMYIESSSYVSNSLGEFFSNAWPKTGGSGTTTSPYIFAATTSSVGISFYSAQNTSASLYDRENRNRLANNLPAHIKENSENDTFIKFIDMTAHHFDGIWTYVNGMSDIYNRSDKLDVGIPKDLLVSVAESLGWKMPNSKDLIELPKFALGFNVTGSSSTVHAISSTTAERDISREIWSRIINNMPYFLKTKGTVQALRGLINCYGVPATILRIKEYGGPDVKNDTPTYEIERKFTKAIDFKGTQYVKTTWANDQNSSRKPDTVELRFKSATGSNQTLLQVGSSWALRLKENGSSDNYGSVSFMLSGSEGYQELSSSQLPIYDGDFYSIMLRRTIIPEASQSYVNDTVSYGANRIKLNNSTLYPSKGKIAISNTEGKDITLEYTDKNDTTGELVGVKGWPKRQIKTADTTTFIAGVATQSRVLPMIDITSDAVNQSIKYDLYVKKYNGGRDKIIYESENSMIISGSEGLVSESYNAQFTASQAAYIGGNNTTFGAQFSGSMMEFRYWNSPLNESAFNNHVASPKSFNGNHASASYTDLVLRYSFDDNINQSTNTSVRDTSADQSYIQTGSAVGFANEINYSSIEEQQNMFIPNIGASRRMSSKIRIETNKRTRQLSVDKRAEKAAFDFAPLDSNKLGLFFAPTDVINEDIILSVADLDFNEYIGDPRDVFELSYRGLEKVAYSYWQKYTTPNNFWDYMRLIKYYDQSMFDQMKILIPARTKPTFGVIIEPNIFERSKNIVNKVPNYEDLEYEGYINVSQFEAGDSRISMSGDYLNYTGSIVSTNTLQKASLYRLTGNYLYNTSSLSSGGPMYVFEEGVQPFISESRYSEHNQEARYFYSSSLSQSLDKFYSSSYVSSELQTPSDLGSTNRHYLGCLQTLTTTIDGELPVEVSITSPTTLVSKVPGDSKLEVR